MSDTTSKDDELRKQLERAGLYDILSSVHESHEDEDCFCTTEIAPFYRQLLHLIKQYGIQERIDELNMQLNGYRTSLENKSVEFKDIMQPLLTGIENRKAELTALKDKGQS